MELHEQRETEERVILVGVEEQAGENAEESLKELGELAETANAQVAGRVIQRRKKFIRRLMWEKGKYRS